MVAASCDPRHTFLHLVSSRDIPFRLENRIRHIRGDGLAAKVNLALNQRDRARFELNAAGYFVKFVDERTPEVDEVVRLNEEKGKSKK